MSDSGNGALEPAILNSDHRLAQSVAVISLWAGLSFSLAYLPSAMLPDMGNHALARFNAAFRTVFFMAPFLTALWLLPPRKRSGDLMSFLNKAWVLAMVTATVLSMVLYSHTKVLTILGGTIGLAISYPAAMRLAEYSWEKSVEQFLLGIQVGFILLSLYVILSGGVVQTRIGAGMIDQSFSETKNIGRNVLTMIGACAFAAALSETGLRRKTSARNLLNWATAGLALYFAYIVPGKQAWGTMALLFAAAFAVMVKRRQWRKIIVIAALASLAAPVVYSRVTEYLFMYRETGSMLTLSGRFLLWEGAINTVAAAKAYLLGFGYDSAFEVSARFLGAMFSNEPLLHFHNEFINAYFDGGIIGATLLSGALFWAFYMACRRIFFIDRNAIEALHVFPFYFIVIVYSGLMTTVTLTTFNIMVPLWLYCCGLLSVGARRPKVAQAAHPVASPSHQGSNGLQALLPAG